MSKRKTVLMEIDGVETEVPWGSIGGRKLDIPNNPANMATPKGDIHAYDYQEGGDVDIPNDVVVSAAKKFGFKGDLNELKIGMKEEQEHSDVVGHDMEAITKIAMAHLAEDPKYYTKLKQAHLEEEVKLSPSSGTNNNEYGVDEYQQGLGGSHERYEMTEDEGETVYIHRYDKILRCNFCKYEDLLEEFVKAGKCCPQCGLSEEEIFLE